MPRDKRRRRSSAKAPTDPQAGPLVPAPLRFRRTLIAVLCAALVMLTFAAYKGVLTCAFVKYDDGPYVMENAHVQRGLDPDSVAWAFTSVELANWHPVTWLSHMLDVQLFGLDAGKHHRTSLALHALNAVLLFLLLVWLTQALWPSALAAALFALHPLHVESVAWVAERKDVLSTLFWLLTLGAWVRFTRGRKGGWYGLALVFYALGLMSKPMLVTLPFTLLLLDYWPLRRLTFPPQGFAPPLREPWGVIKKLLWEKAPFFVLSAASCVITFLTQQGSGAIQDVESFPLSGRIANAVMAYATYLGKTLWPSSLAVFYPHHHIDLPSWPVAGATLLLAGVTAGVIWAARRAPYLVLGWFWYLGTLVPVIGLIQVGVQERADRYTYVPLVGIFITLAWGLADLAAKSRAVRRGLAFASVLALAALLPLTRLQVGYWADSAALFGHALAVTTDNYLAQYNVGLILYHQGRKEEAMAHFQEAVRIKPDYYRAHDNLGLVYADLGQYETAIQQYHEALRYRPDNANALRNLAAVLLRLNRLPEAIERLQQAIRLDPNLPEAEDMLGAALWNSNRIPEAIEHFQRAVQLNPDSALAHHHLGMGLVDQGRFAEAQVHFEEALRINPAFGEARTRLELVRKQLQEGR